MNLLLAVLRVSSLIHQAVKLRRVSDLEWPRRRDEGVARQGDVQHTHASCKSGRLAGDTLNLTNHPSSMGEELTRPGSSSRASFFSVIFPPTGKYTSLAAFTDSTDPKDSL